MKDSKTYNYVDVYERDVYSFTVTGLSLNTEYFFSIMSSNDMGGSDYAGGYVRAKTLSEYYMLYFFLFLFKIKKINLKPNMQISSCWNYLDFL